MSNNRQLVSDIKELDKGITDCENFLAKVLNKKIESSRQVPANKKKNVSSKSSSRPQSRGGVTQTTHQRAPSAGASFVRDTARSAYPARKASAVPSQQRKASPDPKPKSSDGQRRRSTSVSRLASQSCKCEPPKPVSFNKQPVHVHVPRSSNVKEPDTMAPKSQSPSRAVRSRSPGRSKNLPWGEILKENHPTDCKVDRGQWDIGAFHMAGVRHPLVAQFAYSSKLPHECEPIRECSSSECTGVGSCNHFFKVTVPRRPQEESFSSEGTSGFSSNNDLPSNLTNKSVQCGSPIPGQRPNTDQYQHRRVSSTSSGASSQKVEEKEKIIGVLGSDVFSIFNPVRTLNFLIKELQGLLQKHPQEDDSICRVIANMEKVLHRLPEGGEPAESSSGYTTRSNRGLQPQDSHSLASGSSRSCVLSERQLDDEAQRAAILQALKTVPALAQRIDERTESMRKKILEARTLVPVPPFTPAPQEAYTNSVDNILRLQRYVEKSGHQLEIMCQTMEQTCEFLRNERDALQEGMEEKDKKLRVVKSQEQDFVTTVTSLRTNLESATRRVTQLSVENKVLKEQVKLLPSLQESDIKLKQLTAEYNLLHEEAKDLPNLRACQVEVKILNEKIGRLEEENKEIPNLKYIEEKYKQVSTENIKLKEENKIIPALKENEMKVADLTSELVVLQAEKKNLQDIVARSNEEIQKLKDTTQNQVGVAEATKRLTQRLQEIMKERDEAQHDAQMLRIEREKLLVLQHNKDEELNHFVEDIINIKKMVSGQLNILKTNLPKMTPPASISDVLNTSSDSDDYTSASHCQPICSSPTSTASGLAPVDEVWQEVSTILPEHTRSSPEVLVSVNAKKTEETVSPTEFKSIGRDTWQSTHPAAQGEACIPEDKPPQPHTGPGPRQTSGHTMVGDHQWTGAAAVTQELQQNVQELFKFLSNKAPVSSSTEVVSSARTAATSMSSVPSSKQSSVPMQSARGSSRNFHFQMPRLPDPPKFLEIPEFSDFSSFHGSIADSSSVESIDAVLKELQTNDKKRKGK